MREALIIDAVRTPRAERGGTLRNVHPVDLLAGTLVALVERAGVDPERIEDVIVGCVTQTGEQGSCIARSAVLAAGLAEETAGVTLNRFCGSGQQAVHFAAMGILSGQADLVIAGGVEHMTRVPMGADAGPPSPVLLERYPSLVTQGLAAEMIAERWNFSRGDLDAFAARSQVHAARAWKEGRFERSIVPVAATDDNGNRFLFDRDEHPRANTTVEILANLQPSFKPDGVIHAGNSAGIVDGAASLVLASDACARELGLRPRARILQTSVVGSDPILMLTGAVPASRKVLAKAKLRADQIDLIEINETFAPVPLMTLQELRVDAARVNVNGGAIAMGHPLGATGAILIGTLLDELERTGGRTGLVATSVGMGMGAATLIQRID
ncbi:MAG: acetyl-CoA C-acyltransferase [Myxococcales bacterium]|nr:acetyl-CoA C-acyltransferase [Myxococcales bacterium]